MPPISIKAALLIASYLFAFAAGGALMHRLDEGRYQKLVATQARAQTKAVEHARVVEQAQTQVAVRAAGSAAAAQERIVTRTITLTREVPNAVATLVRDHPCVPVGLVRLHDAAAYGISPADVGLPADQPDDACSAVAWPDFAAVIVENYGTARQNAQQLDDLIAFEADRARAFDGVVLPERRGLPAGGAARSDAGDLDLQHLTEYNSMPLGIHIHVHHHFEEPLALSFQDQIDRAVAAVQAANQRAANAEAATAEAVAQRDAAVAALAGDKSAEDAVNEAALAAALDAAGVPPLAPVTPAEPAAAPAAAPAVVTNADGVTDLAASGLNPDGSPAS